MQSENDKETVVQEAPETKPDEKAGQEKKKKNVQKEILSWVLTLASAVVIALLIGYDLGVALLGYWGIRLCLKTSKRPQTAA